MKIKFLKAGKGDCFVISYKGNDGKPHNIIIDGGETATYHISSNNTPGELNIEIDKIKRRDEIIDLVVLTHIDNDHICGLLKWFEMDTNAYKLIGNIWFNSGEQIAIDQSAQKNDDLNLSFKKYVSPETGVNQAIDFEAYISAKGIWEGKLIKQGDIYNICGAKIEVLSPVDKQLLKLLKEYQKKSGSDAYTSGASKDWNKDLREFIEEEKGTGYKTKKSNSSANGSSITFILTIDNKNFLYLGDAPSKDGLPSKNDTN